MGQVISWASTLLVIRMLVPEHYGVMAIASIPMLFADMFGDLGIGAALVRNSKVSEGLLRSIATISYVTGLLLAAALVLASDLFARSFNEPMLAKIMPVLALTFPLNSLRQVPEGMLWRNMAFSRKATAELIATVVSSLLTLILAWRGFGVWSLVVGVVASALLRTILVIGIYRRVVPPTVNFTGTREVVQFSLLIMAEKFSYFLASRVDTFVVARVLGTGPTGVLAVASNLASLPMQKVNGIINDLSLPAFSRVRERGAGLKDHLERSLGWVALVAFPVFFGISATAEPLVRGLLGEKWGEAIPLVMLLSLIVPLQMVANVIAMAMQSVGNPLPNIGLLMGTAFTVGIGIWIFGDGGLHVVALTWLVTYPVIFVLYISSVRKHLGLGLTDAFQALAGPAICATAMWLVVTLLGHFTAPRMHALADLAARTLVGGAIFVLIAIPVCKKQIQGLRSLLAARRET